MSDARKRGRPTTQGRDGCGWAGQRPAASQSPQAGVELRSRHRCMQRPLRASTHERPAGYAATQGVDRRGRSPAGDAAAPDVLAAALRIGGVCDGSSRPFERIRATPPLTASIAKLGSDLSPTDLRLLMLIGGVRGAVGGPWWTGTTDPGLISSPHVWRFLNRCLSLSVPTA